MNKLLLGLLLASGFTFAQVETVSAITPSGVVTEVVATPEPEPEDERVFYVNPELKPYADAFAAAMKADGWDISRIRKHDVFILFDYEIDKNISEDGHAGLAYGMNDDELVYVLISVEAWIELEDFGRQDLMNHELMHDIFNVEHTSEGDVLKLMDTKTFPRDWADTFFRLIDAIKDLNQANGY